MSRASGHFTRCKDFGDDTQVVMFVYWRIGADLPSRAHACDKIANRLSPAHLEVRTASDRLTVPHALQQHRQVTAQKQYPHLCCQPVRWRPESGSGRRL